MWSWFERKISNIKKVLSTKIDNQANDGRVGWNNDVEFKCVMNQWDEMESVMMDDQVVFLSSLLGVIWEDIASPWCSKQDISLIFCLNLKK